VMLHDLHDAARVCSAVRESAKYGRGAQGAERAAYDQKYEIAHGGPKSEG